MYKLATAAVVAMALTAGTAWAARGVVKTQGTTRDGRVFLTGSSNQTGKGFKITVCDYYVAATGAYITQTETVGLFFADEASLFGFCQGGEPVAPAAE